LALFDKPDFSIVDKKIPVSEARIIATLIRDAMLETKKKFEKDIKEKGK
jgi:hypothetical protein